MSKVDFQTEVALIIVLWHIVQGSPVYQYKKNIAVVKVTVLYTVDFLNTAVYRLAVLMFNKLSSWLNLFHFV